MSNDDWLEILKKNNAEFAHNHNVFELYCEYQRKLDEPHLAFNFFCEAPIFKRYEIILRREKLKRVLNENN